MRESSFIKYICLLAIINALEESCHLRRNFFLETEKSMLKQARKGDDDIGNKIFCYEMEASENLW